MTTAPKITLVMPCYNGLKYIQQSVASVLDQTIQDWELLISDDGSTDGTADYLRSLIDARIKVFFQPRNLGIFGNLNFLFTRAAAPITQILCQDDYFVTSQGLLKILELWSNLPPEIAYLRCNHGSERSSRMMRFEHEVLPAIVKPMYSDLYFFIFGCLPGNLSNVSIRTPVVADMGWYRTDLPYAGDFEFWSRVGRRRPWALSRAYVIKIRTHPEQASRTLNKRGELLPQLRLVLMELSEHLHEQGHSWSELRWFAAFAYAAQQMQGGVMGALRGGDWEYVWQVTQQFCGSKYFLDKGLTWVAYFMSVGGRFFGRAMARRLISRHRLLLSASSAEA